MRPTKRLTALVSKLSTVRMIDGLSLQLSGYARSRPNMGQGQAGGTRPYSSRPTPQRSQEERQFFHLAARITRLRQIAKDTSVTCRCDRLGERRRYPLVGEVRVPGRAAIENIMSPWPASGRVFENPFTDNGDER